MGTIWRYLGSATRTKIRIDSSTRRSLPSSAEICWAVIAGGWNEGAGAGAFEAAIRAGLAAAAVPPEDLTAFPAAGPSNDLRMGGRRSSSFFNLETRLN